jgi:hypothetical protein
MEGVKILEDLAKSIQKATPKGVDEAKYKRCKAKVKAKSPNVNEYAVCTASLTKKSLIKSIGPGGIQFDFGLMTGNPIADRATAFLNRFADPVQAEIVAGQATEISNAFSRYISKGESNAFQSAIPDEWTKQLRGGTDEAIKKMYEQGKFDESQPALKNNFNRSEISLGGSLVKATSETDAALIEMMKQGMRDGDSEEYTD